MLLERLAARIDATDYKFDKLEAKVLAKSSAVMTGEQYEADILLVASQLKSRSRHQSRRLNHFYRKWCW